MSYIIPETETTWNIGKTTLEVLQNETALQHQAYDFIQLICIELDFYFYSN